MKTARFYLGPPCGGKSTQSLRAGLPRFSVRHWFEPLRKTGTLPPVGMLLNDALVFQAVEHFLSKWSTSEQVLFDGFPATAEQLDWIERRLQGERQMEFQYCPVDFSTARLRSQQRHVCFFCDGGADPVVPDEKNRCPVCGSVLGKREDDELHRFFRRWDQYAERERQVLKNAREAVWGSLHSQPLWSQGVQMDLHLHTAASDGVNSPETVIQNAAKRGIGLCAVTDHDTVSGLRDAALKAKALGIAFLTGVEISALWEGRTIHLLGYGISPTDGQLQEVLGRNIQCTALYDQQVLQSAEQAGLLSHEKVLAYEKYVYPERLGGWKLLNYFINQGLCRDGFEYLRMVQNLWPQEKEFVPAKDAIRAIRHSGGTCVLAHPGSYNWPEFAIEKQLAALWKLGLRGVECHHPLNSPSVCLQCVNFCQRHNLLETGGSDDHGNLPDRQMGVPYVSSMLLAGTELAQHIH